MFGTRSYGMANRHCHKSFARIAKHPSEAVAVVLYEANVIFFAGEQWRLQCLGLVML